MHADQLTWTATDGWTGAESSRSTSDLVIYFGSRDAIRSGERYRELENMSPGAHILGCSTGGQIHDDDVTDDVISALTFKFDATEIRTAKASVAGNEDSFACGEEIGKALAGSGLAGVFVLCDGLHVNGSALVGGITSVIGHDVPLTGGLAGDGAAFERTLVSTDCEPTTNLVGAVGFYGNAIRIGHGSAGGWDVFGSRRRISESKGSVLYRLDGEPALDLYKRYLGDEADGLPGTALLFPLRIWDPAHPEHDIVRTVLGVDHEKRSLTFAGDMPEGWSAQLMRGNFDRLAAGAADAARQAGKGNGHATPHAEAAILVSCIGRRLLLGQRIADEIEAAVAELGSNLPKIGFYSYGEISPHAVSGVCELHNQTMTVTSISEAVS